MKSFNVNVTDMFEAIGASILKALVAIRAAIIIAAFAFIQIAIETGTISKTFDEPLKTLFVDLTYPFGIGAVLAMFLFFYEHMAELVRPTRH